MLVWLLGDTRIIRDDARLYFRAPDPSQSGEQEDEEVWTDRNLSCFLAFREGSLMRRTTLGVLRLMNEFLPVKELAGKPIDVAVVKQFGLVDNAKLDHFLAAAF